MTRQLIVVDVESTGLHATAAILEVAAVNVQTGEELHFVPWVTDDQLGKASRHAMQINRYYERGVFWKQLSPSATAEHYQQLWDMLKGNTFGGSNPSFDAGLVKQVCQGEPWHHRLADLAAYAGPALLLAPNKLVGLAQVCERLGVQIDGEHTALGDARATAECFRILTAHYANLIEFK